MLRSGFAMVFGHVKGPGYGFKVKFRENTVQLKVQGVVYGIALSRHGTAFQCPDASRSASW